MTTLYIIRGLPGSGKSTYARTMAWYLGISYFEADQYFIDYAGNYNFDYKKLGVAHAQCKKNVFNELEHGRNVIVSNTFTTVSEMDDYVQYALNNIGANIVIVQCNASYGSVHNVPEAAMDRMRKRFVETEKLPYWEQSKLFPAFKKMSYICLD